MKLKHLVKKNFYLFIFLFFLSFIYNAKYNKIQTHILFFTAFYSHTLQFLQTLKI